MFGNKRRRALLLSSALVAIATLGFGPAASAGDQTYQFNIPAESLSQALTDFSQASSLSIIYSEDLVRGRKAPGLHGAYTADAALAALVAGTDLRIETNSAGVMMVRPKNARAASNDEAAPSGISTESVIVTGSLIRGVTNDTSPTMTLDRLQIDQTGFSTTAELMASLPQNYTGTTPQTLLGASARTVSGTNTSGAVSVDLRGLGPNSTLVLLNGERLSGSLFGQVNDISNIPLQILQRVEVATGGRSSLYGSDAVGGVVNFVTREDYDGALTQLTAGAAEDGAERTGFSQIFGQSYDDGGFVAAYNYEHDAHFDAVGAGLTKTTATHQTYSTLWATPKTTLQSAYAAGHWKADEAVELFFNGLFSWKNNYFLNSYASPTVANATVEPGTTQQYDTTAGARINLGDWQVRPEVSLTGTRADGSVVQTQTALTTGKVTNTNTLSVSRYSEDTGSVNADGPLTLAGFDMKAAAGMQWRHEYGSRLSGTSYLFGGREITSVFGEIHAPLIEDGTRSILQVDASGRFDNYSDFGNSFNPNVGVAWSPLPELKLRGAWSTSFRAPDIFAEISGYNTTILNDTDTASPTSISPAMFLTGDANNLRPETAQTWDAGVDINVEGATLSASYYRIGYHSRLASPSIAGNIALLSPVVVNRSPSADFVNSLVAGAVLFTNTLGTAKQNLLTTYPNLVIVDGRLTNVALEQVDGLDFNLKDEWPLAGGTLRSSANLNYTIDHTQNITAASPTVSIIDGVGLPLSFKMRTDIGFSDNILDADVFFNYAGGYTDSLTLPSVPVDGWFTTDVSLAIKGAAFSDDLRGTVLRLTAQNLFDVRPPYVGNQTATGIVYDPANANGLGRILSIQLSEHF